MGYTNYYKGYISENEMKVISDTFKLCVPVFWFKLCGCHGTGKPTIEDNQIVFNGDANNYTDNGSFNDAHESFTIHAGVNHTIDGFCKTQLKPYDLAVKVVLTLADIVTNHRFKVNCDDGGPSAKDAPNWILAHGIITREMLKEKLRKEYNTPKHFIGEIWKEGKKYKVQCKKEIITVNNKEDAKKIKLMAIELERR